MKIFENRLPVLILTKNRPMQFHACLSSLEKYLPQVHSVNIIMGQSSVEMSHLYEQVRYEVQFRPGIFDYDSYEYPLSNVLRNILSLLEINYSSVLLMTDDTLLYRSLPPCFPLTIKDPEVLTISLRMGRNTTVQDPRNPNMPMNVPDCPSEALCGGSRWNWRQQPPESNPGYPASMDGHIYRISDLLSLMKGLDFTNLRTWEAETVARARNDINLPSYMICPTQSVAVNIPMETVIGPVYNSGHPNCLSNEELTQRFALDYRVDLDRTFKDITVKGSHQFIEYKFWKL